MFQKVAMKGLEKIKGPVAGVNPGRTMINIVKRIDEGLEVQLCLACVLPALCRLLGCSGLDSRAHGGMIWKIAMGLFVTPADAPTHVGVDQHESIV